LDSLNTERGRRAERRGKKKGREQIGQRKVEEGIDESFASPAFEKFTPARSSQEPSHHPQCIILPNSGKRKL